MLLNIDHGNLHVQEEPREASRKGTKFVTMGHTRLQGRPRRERTLVGEEGGNGQVGYTSGIPGGHLRQNGGGSDK